MSAGSPQVMRSILFWNRKIKHSVQLRDAALALGTTMEFVCVTNSNKQIILENDLIKWVPSLMLIYSTGKQHIIHGTELDSWFAQLVANINAYKQSLHVVEQQPIQFGAVGGDDVHPILFSDQPKPFRTAQRVDRPLSAPGKMRQSPSPPSQQSELSGIHSAISRGYIAPPDTDSDDTTTGAPEQPIRKEVKQAGLSATEIAKQMADYRTAQDEEIENNRPFL